MPDAATRGGPNACEPPFVEALRTLGVDVTEVTFVFGDNLGGERATDRVRRVVRAARALRAAAAQVSPDIVHLNTSFDPKTVLRDSCTLTVLGGSTPVFLKLHGSDVRVLTAGPWPLRTLARRLLRRAAAIGVLSSAERDAFVAAGVPAEKVHLVRNALPAPEPPPSREAFLAAQGIPGDVPLLLFISRFIPTKGLLDAVRAVGVLRDRGTRVLLACVGDGPARADAETEARRLGVEGDVRFTGYVREDETVGFYAHADALVFPTFHDEGLPVVLLKALGAGLPIVTTRTRAAIDYLREPETCLWVEPHHPEQIADRVERLLGDEVLRHEMGRRAREAAQQFDPVRVAHDYKALYENVVEGGAPRSSAVEPGRHPSGVGRSSEASR
jgi:glycosyltransferase involved in cell wall biosynthesis